VAVAVGLNVWSRLVEEAGWHEEEYRAYGWPFPPTRVRIAQLAEAVEVIRAMWSASPASFKGQHYAIADAHCEPRPDPVPPIMVGGSGERYLLNVVARHADWWNDSFRGREHYAHAQQVLARHCRDVGRAYADIVQVARVAILIAESEREVQRLQRDPGVRPPEEGRVADAPRPEGTWLFAATVLPHL
jgi:alkanesulfonate monooxygenase SsuD/methylene tetrahydromethanopterin reductase-like flavin-dependent oxidoreductase (luciferase family)